MLISASSIQPWQSTLAFASKCKTQVDINQIHASLITTGHIKNTFLISKLIHHFAICKHKPAVDFARHLLFEYGYTDPFLWNLIIRYFSHGKEPEKDAFQVFVLMLVRGVVVDEYSFSLVLKACSKLKLRDKAAQIHGLLSKSEFGSNVFVQNCLLCVYTKCGLIQLGRQVFDRIAEKDSFSYNLMIDGYVKCGMVSLARELFDVMPLEMRNVVSWNTMIGGYVKLENGFEDAVALFNSMPCRDLVSWNLMIDCFAKQGEMEMAEDFFNRMPKRDVVSWATMVDGHAKIGNVDIGRGFFDAMPQRDVISCNAMMAGYVKCERYQEALKVFHDMIVCGGFDLAPDSVTLLTALGAATRLGCTSEGIEVHSYIQSHGFKTSGKLGVALVDMYAKCGSIEQAMHVFERVEQKNIDHWNAMIGGFAIHGLGDLAFELFMEMERLSIKPDDITFIAVLHACSHSGMVKEGLICFEIMRRFHNITPKLQHYGCIVDILSRAGHVEGAAKVVKGMPIKPNDVVFRTLLSACTNQENLNLGEPVAKHLIGMDSYGSSSYILLSNIYAQFGLWDEVRRVRTMMKERDVYKVPGCSSIEVEGTVHEFFAGSLCSHQIIENCSEFDGWHELRPELLTNEIIFQKSFLLGDVVSEVLEQSN